jgi:hypothetical protein
VKHDQEIARGAAVVSDRAKLQRLLAAEFDRRGWQYPLSFPSDVIEEVVSSGQVDRRRISVLIPKTFLFKYGLQRDFVVDVIGSALADQLSLENAVTASAKKVKILFLSSGPADEVPLRLDAEYRDISEGIRSATYRDRIELDIFFAARASDLINTLNRSRPSILHFMGHGGDTGVLLEDNSGKSSFLSSAQLASLLSTADPGLILVVLNCCDSALQAKDLTSVVQASIGMTDSIGDDSARTFSTQLYSSLADGVELVRAFSQAKLAINLAGLLDEDLPRLFVRDGIDQSSFVFAR